MLFFLFKALKFFLEKKNPQKVIRNSKKNTKTVQEIYGPNKKQIAMSLFWAMGIWEKNLFDFYTGTSSSKHYGFREVRFYFFFYGFLHTEIFTQLSHFIFHFKSNVQKWKAFIYSMEALFIAMAKNPNAGKLNRVKRW